MSRRRLFSQTIVESDAFLDMPLTSQSLYFHLCMNADDDGFVNPKRIVRMIGANDDDLKILIAKRYLLVFESGVVVIKHWLISNTIRHDRYQPTTYMLELGLLTKNEFGAYTEIANITTKLEEITDTGDNAATNWQPAGNQRLPQVKLSKVKLKVSSKPMAGLAAAADDDLDHVSAGQNGLAIRVASRDIDEAFAYWHEAVGYRVTSNVKANREFCSKLIREYGLDDLKRMIKGVAMASEDRFAPRVANFAQLYRKWDDLKLWGKKKITSSSGHGGAVVS
jgi:hypothetical protein